MNFEDLFGTQLFVGFVAMTVWAGFRTTEEEHES